MAWIRIALTVSWLPFTFGQMSSVICNNSDVSWTFNSKGQSPCVVAAFLIGPCSDDPAGLNLTPLVNIGPPYYTVGSPGAVCLCNTVVYSLLAACDVCQGGRIPKWSIYAKNCTNGAAEDGIYPLPGILPGTAVPNWAYQKVMRSDSFNLTEAQIVGDLPENSTSSVSTTLLPSLASTSSPTDTATSTGSSPLHPSQTVFSGGSNTGAMVGGVVGGVCGIAAIGAIFTFCLIFQRKRHSMMMLESEKNPRQQAYSDPGQSVVHGSGGEYGSQTGFNNQFLTASHSAHPLGNPPEARVTVF